MDCKRARELVLTDYADGFLRGRDLEELEKHMGLCEGCRRYAGEVKSAGEALRAVRIQQAPPGLWDKVKEETGLRRGISLTGAASFGRIPDLLRALRPVAAAVAAAAVLIVVLASARIAFHNAASPATTEQYDIFALASSDWNGDAGVYDVGTAEEEFFL